MKLKNAESRTTLPWKMSQLESALSHLKNNKSRDPEGYINEIFKSEVAGRNLKESLPSSASVNFNFNFKLEAEIALLSISPTRPPARPPGHPE